MTAPGLTVVAIKKVVTPTGGEAEVMGDAEEARYNASLTAYTTNVTYTEQSDLEDLERCLMMELLCYRWGRWMMSGKEYDGTAVTNDGELRRWIQDYNIQIGKIKEALKLDRKSRESDQAQTFHQKWAQLADHAQEFGIMREAQLGRALEIMHGYSAIIRTYDRSDEEERGKLGFPDEAAIVQFWRDQQPAFDEIDEHFRQNSQRFWVRQP